MTTRINFLPRTYQPPKQLGSKQWGVVAAAAVALAAMGLYYTSVYAGTVRLQHQTEASQLQLQQVKAGLAQAAEIKTREDKVAEAENDLKSLAGRQWSTVVEDLRMSTPQHVAWTSLKASGNTLTLKGTNRGLIDVAQLLGSLVNDKAVDQVNLRYVNEKGIPITVVAKPGTDKSGGPNISVSGGTSGTTGNAGASGSGAAADPQANVLGTFQQMEFEVDIILTGLEGGQPSNGA